MELYINGVDDGGSYAGSGGSLVYSADGHSFIGSSSGTGNFADGRLDDVRVYDRALSAEEIEEVYLEGAGLIAHWKLDEGGGITAYDSAGDNDGTLYGDTSWVAGRIGSYALEFDGDGDYVDVGNDSNLKPDLPVTLSAWIKLSGSGDTMTFAALDDQAYQYYGIWFNVRPDNKVQIHYGDGTAQASYGRRTKNGSTLLSTGTWYHVAAVVRGATDMDLYVDAEDDGGRRQD
jgi:hypothetical protein